MREARPVHIGKTDRVSITHSLLGSPAMLFILCCPGYHMSSACAINSDSIGNQILRLPARIYYGFLICQELLRTDASSNLIIWSVVLKCFAAVDFSVQVTFSAKDIASQHCPREILFSLTYFFVSYMSVCGLLIVFLLQLLMQVYIVIYHFHKSFWPQQLDRLQLVLVGSRRILKFLDFVATKKDFVEIKLCVCVCMCGNLLA